MPEQNSNFWRFGSVVLLLLLLAACAIWYGGNRHWISPPEIPSPDLERVHPLVAEAIQTASETLRTDKYSVSAWADLGRLLLVHDLNADALVCFKYLTEREPTEAKWVYYLGFINEQIEPERAIEFYRRTIELAPDYAAVRLRLAKSLTRLGELAEAEQELRKGLMTSENNPYLEYELALVLLAQREQTEARKLLVHATENRTWYARPAFVALSRLCFSQEDMDCAIAAYQQMSRMPEATSAIADPWLTEVQKQSAILATDAQSADNLMAKGEYELAKTVYQRFIKKRPELTRPRTNLAYCHAMSGNIMEAIRLAQENSRLFPKDSQVQYALASIYEQAGKFPQAATAYETCLALAPQSADAWLGLGLLQQRTGKFSAAQVSLEHVVNFDPRNVSGRLALGEVLQQLNDLDGAIEQFEFAATLVPGEQLILAKLNQAKTERDKQ